MKNVIPITMVKNEEHWIRSVVSPALAVFGNIIVADTGSTDSTVDILSSMNGITLMRYNNAPVEKVGVIRQEMQEIAREMGAEKVFLIDGDELYPISYLRYIRDNPPPGGFLSAFTYGIECGETEDGQCWIMGRDGQPVGVSRQAIFSVDSVWRGVYPFEGPDTFIPGDPRNFYYNALGMHFYHLHGMIRSSKDHEVHMRIMKRKLFSLQEHPEIQPMTLWLKSRDEYRDSEL